MQILLSIVITVIVYSVFPLLFAAMKKTPITSSRYRLYCFLFNFVLHVLLTTIGIFANSANIAPMLIWTWIATAFGKKILQAKDCLSD